MESSYGEEGVHCINIQRETVRSHLFVAKFCYTAYKLLTASLIWNLYMSGKTSIQHILQSHYRAITDINWHTTDPDIVVSTGIDSWLWTWDLRTMSKPVMGTYYTLQAVR